MLYYQSLKINITTSITLVYEWECINKGEDGIFARDIMYQLPASVKTYREEFNSITKDYYHNIYLI